MLLLRLSLLGLILHPTVSILKAEEEAPPPFVAFSLEELANMTVTTVSKKEQRLQDTPAAIHVITREDLRRSGVTSLADSLRMVPGMNVGQIHSSAWSVSARGASGRFADKLLVMVDGRPVYTPIFAGTYWDMQEGFFETEVQQIEVIRGPGAATWGANAVNGVVNIITRPTLDTVGGRIIVGVGNVDHVKFATRYGWEAANEVYARVYGNFMKRGQSDGDGSFENSDNWDQSRFGLNLDWTPSEDSFFSGQVGFQNANAIEQSAVPSLAPPYVKLNPYETDINSAYAVGRLEQKLSDYSEASVQVYYDRLERKTKRGDFVDLLTDIVDVEFQHFIRLGQHELNWGLGHRWYQDELMDGGQLDFDDATVDFGLFSAFAQDEIYFLDDQLRIAVGAKYEKSDFSGDEFQPNIRGSFSVSPQQTLWAAISKAVRTPSRIEQGGTLTTQVLPAGALSPEAPLSRLRLKSNSQFSSEEVTFYEVGHRYQPSKKIDIDQSVYFKKSKGLRSFSETPTITPALSELGPIINVDSALENGTDSDAYGYEVNLSIRPSDDVKMQLAYTYFKSDVNIDLGIGEGAAEQDLFPNHIISWRTGFDLPNNIELDFWTHWRDDIDGRDLNSLLTLDIRLGWQYQRDLDLSLVVQNLFGEDEVESQSDLDLVNPSRLERAVYLQLGLTL